MSDFDYDLFVIGAGSGGVRAARISAGYGARVAVAESYRVGGTCVIRGCVPKKLLVYASQYSEHFEQAEGFGWTVGPRSFDWQKLIAAKDREIARLEGIYGNNLLKAGVEIIEERASLVGPNTVRLEASGREVTAGRILIATGAKPFVPAGIPGIELAITSNEAFHLTELPRRVLVVGGGYIAVEFAGIFNGLGSETTLIYRGEEILRGFDGELRRKLHEELSRKHIGVRVKTDVISITAEGAEKRVRLTSGEEILVDAVMYATGRIPNVAGLGLEAAGIALNASGAIPVDAWSRTTVPSIFAVGDVTNRSNLTPVAIREGHAFADTEFGGKDVAVDHRLIPTAVFSQPEIGTVGLSEEEAVALYPAVDVYKTDFRPMKHTLSGGSERVFMKMLVDAETDKVLGVHLIGGDAGELIQIIGVTLSMGATKADYDRTVAVHPTAAEELVTMRSPSERLRRS